MINKHLTIKSLVAILLIFPSFLIYGEVSLDLGRNLFRQYCGQCHARNMVSAATGPALAGTQELWGDDEALYAWIRNSQALIAQGHPRAVELWNQYKPNVMTAFPDLTDDEIGSILAYINGVAEGTYPPRIDGGPGGAGVAAPTETPQWVYWLLVLVLGGLAILMTRIINNLNKLAALQDGKDDYEDKTIWQMLTSKGVITFAIFALVLFAGYTTVNNAVNLGRQQGYAPEQPIKFSHETHAGLHKIDCQYCHDGARRSKHSVIPAANTCMNCHQAIRVGSTYGTAELTKIFASIGYDPISNTYIEDYDNYSTDDIKELYTAWIEQEYLTAKEATSLDAEGQLEVRRQWDQIVASLTNEQKRKIQGPIEWIRIHNLPDHVYFNHAQHVTIGKIECQTCHGKVEEMEVLYQASPLSMGWCINCHRQTEVKFSSNDYYASYAKFHDEIQKGTRDKVTVADIGGLECQKCHY
ncbi:MAG TPA: c-type cytochrome [Saprospiraceae bacterium]|nr:c-type cytochrome [Saprospiraceae bacterium]